MTDLVKLARQRIDDRIRIDVPGRHTHWEGCERDHHECLIQRMADQIERLQAECLRLNHAEAEAVSVVGRMADQIERLKHQANNDICEIERLREVLQHALSTMQFIAGQGGIHWQARQGDGAINLLGAITEIEGALK